MRRRRRTRRRRRRSHRRRRPGITRSRMIPTREPAAVRSAVMLLVRVKSPTAVRRMRQTTIQMRRNPSPPVRHPTRSRVVLRRQTVRQMRKNRTKKNRTKKNRTRKNQMRRSRTRAAAMIPSRRERRRTTKAPPLRRAIIPRVRERSRGNRSMIRTET